MIMVRTMIRATIADLSVHVSYSKSKKGYRKWYPLLLDYMSGIRWPYFRVEKSNDVSRNLVVNFPERNVGLSINLI
jgi:hypothetical protein